jgi:hypothetical protein
MAIMLEFIEPGGYTIKNFMAVICLYCSKIDYLPMSSFIP